MAQRGRGSSYRASRGHDRGRGGGRGRGGRGGSGRGRGATQPRNGFRASRVEDIEDKSDDEQNSTSDIEQSDQESDEEDTQSASEDEVPAQKSYSSLLQALNAKSTVAEPPRKKRRISEKDEDHAVSDEVVLEVPAVVAQEHEAAEAGLTEIADEDDEHVDSDDEDVVLHDPFEKHYASMEEKELSAAITAVKEKQKKIQNTTLGTEGLKKTTTAYDTVEISKNAFASEKDLRLKQRLVAGGSRIYRTLASEEKDVAKEIMSYKDIQCGIRTIQNTERYRSIASLHVLNHVFKTRDRVLKNNAKASQQDGDESLDLRDQGFTRPKVLIIVPTKQACVRFINSIVEISESDQQENKSRFLDTYSADDDDAWHNKPEDFRELFGGNHEEDFRVGLKFTRKTIKYFSGFYNSDIIFGSALGLMRTITTGGGGSKDKKKTHDADFLSSIEIVIVDHASAIQMQNWQHLEYVFTQLNLLPKDSHGCDFSRVRNWYLDGHAQYLRQTILFTTYHTPEINSLISNHTHNIAGLVKYTPTYLGAMLSLPPTLAFTPSQTFLRFESPTPTADFTARFTYFTTTILPILLRQNTKGTLLYIPTYADFTRLRNYLSTSSTTTSLSFASISEYSPVKDVARARSHFMNERHSLLIYSERAHHHFRYKLKGVKRIVFYGVPDNPLFWGEVVGMLALGDGVEDRNGNGKKGEKGVVRALFSRWDVLKLERIVGSERVGRLIGERGGDTFEFV